MPSRVLGVPPFVSLSAGDDHTCGLTQQGVVHCWGRGLTGIGMTASGRPFVGFSAGGRHRCAWTAEGEASCWGTNEFGELGTGGTTATSTPVPVAGGLRFASVSAGRDYSCGLLVSGEAYCWGFGAGGRLGTGSVASSPLPLRVTGGLRFTQIDVGTTHTCAVASSGAGYCWGADLYGALGDGPFPSANPTSEDLVRPGPRAVVGEAYLAAITVGGTHACARSSDGRTRCWGDNRTGALGIGGKGWIAGFPLSVRESPQAIVVAPR